MLFKRLARFQFDLPEIQTLRRHRCAQLRAPMLRVVNRHFVLSAIARQSVKLEVPERIASGPRDRGSRLMKLHVGPLDAFRVPLRHDAHAAANKAVIEPFQVTIVNPRTGTPFRMEAAQILALHPLCHRLIGDFYRLEHDCRTYADATWRLPPRVE